MLVDLMTNSTKRLVVNSEIKNVVLEYTGITQGIN